MAWWPCGGTSRDDIVGMSTVYFTRVERAEYSIRHSTQLIGKLEFPQDFFLGERAEPEFRYSSSARARVKFERTVLEHIQLAQAQLVYTPNTVVEGGCNGTNGNSFVIFLLINKYKR
jgi:hypothetical protein